MTNSPRLCKWITSGLFVVMAAFDCHAQQPAQGDIFESGGKALPADGDVFESGGRGGPGDIFLSGGRCAPGSPIFPCCIDHCCMMWHTIPTDHRTIQCGLPIWVKMGGNLWNHLRCTWMAGNDCYPGYVLCWGRITDRDKTSDTPTKLDKQTPKSDNTKDPNRHFSLNARRDKVCTLQRLAGLIMSRYGTGLPIGTVKVVNSNRPNTYLVLLPGMEQKRGQATMAGDSLIGYMNLSALDAYRLAIMDAVQKLPPGATLILAGHSQGGIEAQNIVQRLEAYGYKVAKVITFGAPIMDVRQPGTNYLNVRALGDPIRALDRRRNLEPGEDLTSHNGTDPNPFSPNSSHNNYDKDSSGLKNHLITPCWEIDLTTLQGTPAPDLFTRITGIGKPECPPPQTGPPVKCSWQPKAPLPAGTHQTPLQRGLLLPDENYLKQIAASKCLVILVRDSTPPALRWINQPTYKPKPEAIKGKTLKKEVLEKLGFPPDQVKQYEGLASARDMTPAEKKKLIGAGYNVQSGEPQLIIDQDGSKFYSDTDLAGVYDANGNNAWSPELGKELKCGTRDQGIQHPPHDDWKDRNNPGIAGENFGPQIGDCRTMTAIFPDGRTLQIGTLDQMKQLYKAIGVNFSQVYPYSYPKAELPCPKENQ